MNCTRLGMIAVLIVTLAGTASAKNTLAEAYVHSAMQCLERNESEKALRLFGLALQEAAECESADILPIALLGAGEAEYKLGRIDKAKEYFRACAQFQDTVDDDDHPVLRVAALNNLMLAQTHQKEFLEAEAVGQKTLAILEGANLDDHELMVATLNNLSIAKAGLDKHDEAKSLALRSQTLLQAIAEDHPAAYQVADTLAHVYHLAKDLPRAEAAANQAVEHARNHHGDKSLQHAEALTTLGKVAKSQGRHAESEKALRLALEIFAETTHDDHPSYQAARAQLGTATGATATGATTTGSATDGEKAAVAAPEASSNVPNAGTPGTASGSK